MRRRAHALCRDEAGTTAWEYALIASLIVLGIVGAVTTFGTATSRPFQQIDNAFSP